MLVDHGVRERLGLNHQPHGPAFAGTVGGNLRQRPDRIALARPVRAALLVFCRSRQLQPDPWLARAGHRLHGHDPDLDRSRAARRRVELRDGIPDRPRQDGRQSAVTRLPPGAPNRCNRYPGPWRPKSRRQPRCPCNSPPPHSSTVRARDMPSRRVPVRHKRFDANASRGVKRAGDAAAHPARLAGQSPDGNARADPTIRARPLARSRGHHEALVPRQLRCQVGWQSEIGRKHVERVGP